MTGFDVLCAGLADLGVRHVFGIPGTQNAALFSALPEHGIRPVLATHEASAAFMANGYARASGWVGVLATIPGPGFTFAFPGLAEARLDSVPLLHLVGQPARGTQRFRHQAIDQAGMAAPFVKRVIEVEAGGEITARLRQAHTLALSGEPGPVILHLSHEALRAEVTNAESGAPEAASALDAPTPEWVEPLRRLVDEAERPVLFLGGGTLGCAAEVQAFAEKLSAPTFTTLTARGVLPEDHPSATGFDADRGGLTELNDLLHRSDLILALGCKFSHNGTSGFGMRLPREKLVHVNTDPEALGSSYPAKLEITASVDLVLAHLRDGPDVRPRRRWSPDELAEIKALVRKVASPRVPEPRFTDVTGGTPEAFFGALRRALPRDAIVVTDSGLHQVMTRRYLDVLSPRGLITPADFQSMGFGIPAALGARIAEPTRPVIAIVGDGGFLMSAMDLACAARERVPVVVVVFNDGYLNLIRMQQVRDEGRDSGTRLETPDLGMLAEAMSVRYAVVEGDVEAVVRDALASERSTVLEVRLGDSPAIRKARGVGLVKRAVRRTLGERLLGGMKALMRALGGR